MLHTHTGGMEKKIGTEKEKDVACLSSYLIQTSAVGPKFNFGLYILGCSSVKQQKIAHAGNVIQLIMA